MEAQATNPTTAKTPARRKGRPRGASPSSKLLAENRRRREEEAQTPEDTTPPEEAPVSDAQQRRAALDAKNRRLREALGLGDRIRRRREEMDLTQDDVARRVELTRAAIAQWESNSTSPTVIAIANLARVLECRPEWLMFGIEQPEAKTEVRLPDNTVAVTEVEATAGGQGFELSPREGMTWGLPKSWVQAHCRSRQDQLVMMEVQDDSMDPEFSYGDRVLVDLSDVRVTTGVYVIWNGVAPQLYHLQVIPRSGQAPVLRMRNRTGEGVDLGLEEVMVIGRVRGRWTH
jgi:transcriptional regulator with XRE-family HTH domain